MAVVKERVEKSYNLYDIPGKLSGQIQITV